jgi:DNA-binding transcriptional regulator YiaG
MLSNEVSAAVAATARCSYWRAADARVVLAAWMDSDLSLSAFARHFGISVQRLRRWRDALAVERITSPRPA